MTVILVSIMLHDLWQPLAGPDGMSGVRNAIRPACQPAAITQYCIVLFSFEKSCPGVVPSQ